MTSSHGKKVVVMGAHCVNTYLTSIQLATSLDLIISSDLANITYLSDTKHNNMHLEVYKGNL